MFVTSQQVSLGISNYIENEIAKKAVGVNKFVAYFVIPNINKSVIGFMNKAMQNEFTKEFFDENGNIDLDELYNNAKEAIKKSGQIEAMGIIFNETDVDKLYSYIKSTTI